ncbi:MAG: hypothetical protein AABX88_01095 [Nanoarchaeota archaeon]
MDEELTNISFGGINNFDFTKFSKSSLVELGELYAKVENSNSWRKLLIDYPGVKVELEEYNLLPHDPTNKLLSWVNDYLNEQNLYLTNVEYSPANFLSDASIKGKIHRID